MNKSEQKSNNSKMDCSNSTQTKPNMSCSKVQNMMN
jgi:hypothetical protein